MKLKFATIASSSSGNCIYLGTGSTNILIDAGLSGKKIEEGLSQLDLQGRDIDAIFITHEHIDHVDGVGVMSRRYDIPVYATEGTWANMPKKVGDFRPSNKRAVYANENCFFNDISIKPFTIPHDASEPVGYSFMADNEKVTIATDIGHISEEIEENIQDSTILLLESNHDINMLKNGAYPYHLKQRILGDYGHLSNIKAGDFISSNICNKLKYIFLGHLSGENNTPRLAFDTVNNILSENGAVVGGDFGMWVACPYGVKRVVEV